MDRSYKKIICSHLFTFFNFLNLAFFVLIVSVGSYKNGLFMMVIVLNTAIGIFQEIRTKKQLDRLSLVTRTAFPVRRGEEEFSAYPEEMCAGDEVRIGPGDQVPADGTLISGELEADESMLSGESDSVEKHPGDRVLSGSFVISGEAVLSAETVGKETYAASLSEKARAYREKQSELKKSLNTILHLVAWLIIPLAVLLFVKLYLINHTAFKSTIEQVVTSGVGMIPEGLILLSSMSLALGAFNLASRNTLVQQLYSIESLARVDVICLDKTGTLTTGKVIVDAVYPENDPESFKKSLSLFASAFSGGNATMNAVQAYVREQAGAEGEAEKAEKAVYLIPFSSERKYSGAVFSGRGTLYMGASAMLFPADPSVTEKAHALSDGTGRMLALAYSPEEATSRSLPEKLQLLGFIRMKDEVRLSCRETLRFFEEQGVALKLISGDDPFSVSRIAGQLDMKDSDAYVDLTTLHSDDEIRAAAETYTIFGRVRPEEKRLLIETLQQKGHSVAMVGDGVNDVLALKCADCSVAMGNGADAAKKTADVVLTDSDFAAMPYVLNEGRRVINNIGRSASMYLVKTFFSLILTMLTLLFGYHYPFLAIQLTLISACAVGIPTFFLQMEPSYVRVKKDFIRNVLKAALPSGIMIAAVCIFLVLTSERLGIGDAAACRSLAVFVTAFIYFFTLIRLYPLNSLYRAVVIGASVLVFILAAVLFGKTLFELQLPNKNGLIAGFACIAVSVPLILFMQYLSDKTADWFRKLRKRQNA